MLKLSFFAMEKMDTERIRQQIVKSIAENMDNVKVLISPITKGDEYYNDTTFSLMIGDSNEDDIELVLDTDWDTFSSIGAYGMDEEHLGGN